MCENSAIPEQQGECDSGKITQNYQPQYTDLHKLPISLKLIKGTHCQCCFLGSMAVQQVCTVSLTLAEGFFSESWQSTTDKSGAPQLPCMDTCT